MFCKQTQKDIDTILALKSNEDLCVNIINGLMDEHKTQNKIASTTSSVQEEETKGEVAELQRLLKTVSTYIH